MKELGIKHPSPKSYLLGYVFSIILSILAFTAVKWNYSKFTIITILLIFAITQLLVQVIFFLHLNKEQAPKWNLLMFLLAGWFVLAIVIGSIWIMANLDYNMMPNEHTDKSIIEDEGYHPIEE